MSWRTALWPLVRATIFSHSFHNQYRLRNALLRLFGATVDETSRIRASVWIDQPWNLTIGRKSSIGDRSAVYAHAPVRIGSRSVCSQHTILGAFVIDDRAPRPASIDIGDDVWVAADSVIEGGTTLPDGALIGARSCVATGASIKPWTIAAGLPARSIKPRPYKGRS